MSNDRIAQLGKEIHEHNDLYWNKNDPIISDTDYDLLVNELLSLDPTSTVPYEFAEAVDAGKAVKHNVMMLSMDKAYAEEEIIKWAKKLDGDWVTLSPKIDGSAACVRYENGEMVLAATRGTGVEGENVTSAAKLISNLPKRIPSKDPIEVRGEVCVKLSDFAKLKGNHSNPRNTASGALKRINPASDKHEKIPLTFYAYNVLGTDCPTESEKFKFLREQGFTNVATKSVQRKDLEEAFKDMAAERSSWDYEADGLIIMAGDVSEQESLGSTRHHPRYAIALKFQGESGTTVLNEIEWSVSRTQAITPVALVNPVNLSGANISRISLHNVSQMRSKGFAPKDEIEVSRRGGVIPQAERVVKASGVKAFEHPKQCPVCKAPTVVKVSYQTIHGSKEKVEVLYCTGDSCPAQVAGQIEHFVKVLEIDGLGSTIIEQICRSGVRKPTHLFKMTVGGLIRNVDRMGEKNAQKIIDNIAEKREIPLHVFLRSLGIDELGNHVSEAIAKKYDNIADVMMLKVEDLIKLPKVGETIAKTVIKGLKENDGLVRDLLKFIKIIKPDASNSGSGRFSGQSFVFTGVLVRMGRSKAQKAAKALGADTPSGVKKDLTYLVVGGRDRTSTKCQKAQKYIDEGADIKIISESEFVEMIQGKNDD